MLGLLGRATRPVGGVWVERGSRSRRPVFSPRRRVFEAGCSKLHVSLLSVCSVKIF